MAEENKKNYGIISLRNNAATVAQSEDFLKSLERIDHPAPKISLQPFDIMRYLFIALFSAVFIISSANVAESVASYIKGRELYGDIAELWEEDNDSADDGIHLKKNQKNEISLDAYTAADVSGTILSSNSASGGETMAIIKARLNKMRAINDDIFGWIEIKSCDVSYPVVQSNNNSFYLRRDFYKNSLNAGCIFADYRNSKNLNDNRNTVIYGHNMNDGSMFAGIHNFENESTFNTGEITLTTFDGVFTYEVFSVHVPYERSDYFRTDFTSDADFLEWAQKMKAQSTYYKDIDLKATDKILTLSTCVNTTTLSSYRFAVHARLKSVQK